MSEYSDVDPEAWGAYIKEHTLDKCPKCNRNKQKKNDICGICRRKITPYIKDKERKTWYCQNTGCDRRGIELPKSEMVFKTSDSEVKGRYWLCKECKNKKL